MYVCIYMYVCRYVYVHVYVRAFVWVGVYMLIYACVCMDDSVVCVCVCVCVCLCVDLFYLHYSLVFLYQYHLPFMPSTIVIPYTYTH